MDRYIETEEITELTKSVRAEKSIAFIGSGLSMGEYTSWGELIDQLCDACGIDKDALDGDIDYLELAGQAKKASPDEYHRILSEEFGKDDIHLPLGYTYLLESPFSAFITINYDPLLAEASRFKKLKLYDFKDGLEYSRIKDKAIFYIHGYVERGGRVTDGDLILTEEDFEHNYDKAGAIIPSFLTQIFSFKPVVFIGCGLQEPALRNILRLCNEIKRRIEARADNNGPTHFILLPTLYTRTSDNEQPVRDMKKEEEENAKYYEDGVKVIRYVRESPDDFKPVEKILEYWSEAPEVKPINVYDDEGPTL